MTSVERLDLINLEARDIKINKGQVLLSFHTVGLNNVKVYLIKESAEALRNRWHQDTTKARVECSRQLIQRLSSSILPLLKKKQHVNLDLRNEIFNNNLVLARVNNELCCLSHQLLDEKKITFSNKILLLNYLREKLFDGTVPSNNCFLDGTVPSNNCFLDGTVPSNNLLFDGTLQPKVRTIL